MNDGGIVGVEKSDLAAKNEKCDGHAEHEERAEPDGGGACASRAGTILTAEGLSNADGCGGREAERNHVGKRDGVERDLVASLRDGAEARDQRSGEGEDAYFGGELAGGGNAESEKMADAAEVDVDWSVAKFGVMAVVVPEEIADEKDGEVGARDGGGDAGASDAESGSAEFAVDEDPVADEVDDVGGDESEGNGAHHVHALECAANGEVQEQRKHADGEGAHVRSGENDDAGFDAHALVKVRKKPNGKREQRSDSDGEIDAVDEGAVAIFATTGAKGLRDESVEADEQTFSAEGEDDEEAGADADGGDGFGAAGEATDHDGVNDVHAHPAEFGEDERKGEAQSGAQLGAEFGEAGHGTSGRSVRGEGDGEQIEAEERTGNLTQRAQRVGRQDATVEKRLSQRSVIGGLLPRSLHGVPQTARHFGRDDLMGDCAGGCDRKAAALRSSG